MCLYVCVCVRVCACVRVAPQIRNQGGERDTTYSGVFDVSNRHRLGYSEVQLVQTMLDGLQKLIELEKKLEAGETVTL